jgi:lipoate---protein ligase
MLALIPYDLPDEELLEPRDECAALKVFVPPQTLVVIGKGSNPEQELNLEAIARDSIPVMRRASGGCAVVLSPNMLVVASANYEQPQPKSRDFFQQRNDIILRALSHCDVNDVAFAGTSDLALRGKKIAGTAIYRNRNVVFYHAILNLNESPEMIAKYLQVPPRMPEYRRQRTHVEFVTSLAREGFFVESEKLTHEIESEFTLSLNRKETESCM